MNSTAACASMIAGSDFVLMEAIMSMAPIADATSYEPVILVSP
jgi:hypothetical protein